MAIGERFRSGGAHGIARFLAEHQGCNSGFDVRRDEQFGTGKLSITCGGCGASVEYRAAEAGELAAGGPQPGPVPANGSEAALPPPPAPADPPPAAPPAGAVPPFSAPPPPSAPFAPGVPTPLTRRAAGTPTFPGMNRAQPSSRRSSGRVPGWLSVALIGALILGGLTMIAIGLTKEENQQPAATPPSGQAPAEGKQGQSQAQPQAQKPATGEGARGAVALNRKTFQDTFSIGVPRGWNEGTENGGIALSAPGSTAEIVVFFQQGETPLPQLAQGARGFLAQRHAGAQVGPPQPTRIGAQRGLRITAAYQGGEEVAVVISAKGFSHVVLRRVDRGASPDLEQQAEAALASFKPE
jgi:hypothetical protein